MEIGGEENATLRITKDLDLAVLATDVLHFEEIRSFFVKEEGYSLKNSSKLSVFSPENIQIDLLPYGPIEIDHEILLGGTNGAFQVEGFQEACENAINIQYQELGEIKVISPGGFVLLKFIAFDDRPTAREKDLDDLSSFLSFSFSLFFDDIQEKHWDILASYSTTDNYSLEVGSHYLGRMLRKTVGSNDTLKNRISNILEDHLNPASNLLLINKLSIAAKVKAEDAVLALKALFQGFSDKLE
ncbi:MAG: hypothetical protein AAF655_27405 [Bacteroidota bacterium]